MNRRRRAALNCPSRSYTPSKYLYFYNSVIKTKSYDWHLKALKVRIYEWLLVMHCKYNPIEGNELTCISTTLRKFEIKRASLDHYQQALVCAPIDSSSSQGHSLRACFHSPPLLADTPYVSVWSVSAFWFLKVRVTDSSLCFTETALDLERDWWTPIHLCQNPSRFSSGPGTTGAHNWKKLNENKTKTSPEPAVQCLDMRKFWNWPTLRRTGLETWGEILIEDVKIACFLCQVYRLNMLLYSSL